MVASALQVDVTGVTGQSLQRVTGKPDHIKLYRVHFDQRESNSQFQLCDICSSFISRVIIGNMSNGPQTKSAPSQIGPSQIGPRSNRIIYYIIFIDCICFSKLPNQINILQDLFHYFFFLIKTKISNLVSAMGFWGEILSGTLKVKR